MKSFRKFGPRAAGGFNPDVSGGLEVSDALTMLTPSAIQPGLFGPRSEQERADTDAAELWQEHCVDGRDSSVADIARRPSMRWNMKWLAAAAFVLAALTVSSTSSLADPVLLQETLFNLNGTPYNTTAVPGLNSAGFDSTTGLGTLVLTFSPGASGSYFFDAFFNHQLHEPFFNEYGSVSGAPGSGMTWQIDEPEIGDGNRVGTIYTNTLNNALDNTNHIPGTTSNFLGDCGGNTLGGTPDATCNNDVSLALGFNFSLSATEQAIITLEASKTAPVSGFFLQQLSPADGSPADNLYLTGTLAIAPADPVAAVPEPASVWLLGTGLIGVAYRVFRTKRPPTR